MRTRSTLPTWCACSTRPRSSSTSASRCTRLSAAGCGANRVLRRCEWLEVWQLGCFPYLIASWYFVRFRCLVAVVMLQLSTAPCVCVWQDGRASKDQLPSRLALRTLDMWRGGGSTLGAHFGGDEGRYEHVRSKLQFRFHQLSRHEYVLVRSCQ